MRGVTPEFVSMSKEIFIPQIQGVTVVVLKLYKFQICLFTPPLGDFQVAPQDLLVPSRLNYCVQSFLLKHIDIFQPGCFCFGYAFKS
jgi:hypothetical protein